MTTALDDIAPAFRDAKERWPDAPNMQAHYDDLVRSFETNGSSLIELCKSFLEMVCVTVLNELGGDVPTNGSTTQYVVAALDKLGLRNTRGASAFDKVLSAHNKLADALTEVRNQEGSVAHGKDGFIDAMSDRHARVYLLSADTIISLILQAYDGIEPSILKTREPHNRFVHHNVKIDAGTQIEAQVDEDGVIVLSFRAGSLEDGFELRVSASELLYYLDRQAYVDVLEALRGIKTEVEEEGVEAGDTEDEYDEGQAVDELPAESAEQQQKTETRPLEPVTEYQGKYADKVTPLYEYIVHTILSGNEEDATQILNLTYTLLNSMEDLAVVDWQERHSTKSKVRLFVKKLSKLFSIDELERDSLDQIVEWLAVNIRGGES